MIRFTLVVTVWSAVVLVAGCHNHSTHFASRGNLANFQANHASVAHQHHTRATKHGVAASEDDAQLIAARSLEKQGKYDQAAQLYHQIASDDIHRPAALHRLAVLHDRRGEHEQARQYYEQAMEHDPNNAELLCDYGYSCILQGELHSAHEHLRRSLELAPNLRRARNNLGVLYARFDKHEEAVAQFVQGGCTQEEAQANLKLALATLGPAPEVAQRTRSTPSAADLKADDQPARASAKKGETEVTMPRRVTSNGNAKQDSKPEPAADLAIEATESEITALAKADQLNLSPAMDIHWNARLVSADGWH